MPLRLFKGILLLLAVLFCGAAHAAETPCSPDSVRISLLTCSPGPEIFELYGHEAVRVSGLVGGREVDQVFKYGVFDYNATGFVYRFVKGETDYYVDVMPTQWFIETYMRQGRRVVEQVLPLSPGEAIEYYGMLLTDMQPENRSYRYKYFSNNCATRLLDKVEQMPSARNCPVTDLSRPSGTTYRELIRKYNTGYPWYQLGIDLALGSMIDEPVTVRQTMFIPMELARYYGKQEVLVDGRGDVRKSPTPWYLSPVFAAWMLFACVAVMLLCGRRWRAIYSFWFLLCGLAGTLVCYLVFLSSHEGTSPNWLAWWLNPLWFIPAVTVWVRPLGYFTRYAAAVPGIATLLLLAAWPLLPQCGNPAFFPLMATTVILSLRLPR